MLTNSLLDFLLNLFADPEAADDFRADPDGALASAGFGNLCSEDVESVMPVILDSSPITMNREYNTGGNGAWGGNAGGSGGNGGGGTGGGGTGGGGTGGGGTGGGDDHAAAVQQLVHVLNNYSYTSVDDRDVVLDQSTNQNIWANGDVHQLFDQSAVIASGDGAFAAGGDLDVKDSFNTKDSYNDESDNSVTVNDDHSVHIDDSYNDESETDNSVDNSIEDSYNDESETDNSIDVELEDSFNDNSEVDNSTETDTEIEDSYNDESEVDNSLDVEIEDAFNDESETDNSVDNSTETDVDVEVEESIVLVP